MSQFQFPELNSFVRKHMLKQLRDDILANRIFFSPRLSDQGTSRYLALLWESIEKGDAQTLANAIRKGALLKEKEMKRFPNSQEYYEANVPENAPEQIAENAFNYLYMKALCKIAIASNLPIEIYRAKETAFPRKESEEKLGWRVSAAELLEDLNTNYGFQSTKLGVPAGPNSGLSVRLIKD